MSNTVADRWCNVYTSITFNERKRAELDPVTTSIGNFLPVPIWLPQGVRSDLPFCVFHTFSSIHYLGVLRYKQLKRKESPMNKKIIMAIVACLCMLGMNAEAHCGYYRHHGYYHRSAANAFWAGAACGIVGAAVGNAIAHPQYVITAPQQVVVQPAPQVVYEQPVQQVVYQEPIVRHIPRSAYQQPVYVQQVHPQVVQQPTYTYNTTTVVQQPQRQTTPLVGVGVNVLGLKVGVGAGF